MTRSQTAPTMCRPTVWFSCVNALIDFLLVQFISAQPLVFQYFHINEFIQNGSDLCRSMSTSSHLSHTTSSVKNFRKFRLSVSSSYFLA